MKLRRTMMAILILLLASVPVRADNSRLFFLRVAVTMGGAAIPMGIYDLSWESQGPTVRVTLWKNGRFIATAQGHWAKHDVKYTEDAALVRVNTDGSRTLAEIRLSGMKKTIVLESVDPIIQLSVR